MSQIEDMRLCEKRRNIEGKTEAEKRTNGVKRRETEGKKGKRIRLESWYQRKLEMQEEKRGKSSL